MLIDWFTVGAQTLNFLVLVWLLKRFLYRPILDAIDAREKRIAAELADADEKKAAAMQERDEFQQKNAEFDQQRAELMSRAASEAKAEQQRLFDQVRKEADALRAKRQQALEAEQKNLNGEISHRIRDEVFSIARKTLRDLSGTTLEARMGEVFVQRLQTLEQQQKDALSDALEAAKGVLHVRSAFPLSPAQQTAIQQVLDTSLAQHVHVTFDTAPDVISGIELVAGGWKISWTIADYLASMEKKIGEFLQEQATQGAPSGAPQKAA